MKVILKNTKLCFETKEETHFNLLDENIEHWEENKQIYSNGSFGELSDYYVSANCTVQDMDKITIYINSHLTTTTRGAFYDNNGTSLGAEYVSNDIPVGGGESLAKTLNVPAGAKYFRFHIVKSQLNTVSWIMVNEGDTLKPHDIYKP